MAQKTPESFFIYIHLESNDNGNKCIFNEILFRCIDDNRKKTIWKKNKEKSLILVDLYHILMYTCVQNTDFIICKKIY